MIVFKQIPAIFLTLSFGLLSPAVAMAATLSLSPSSGTVSRGCNVALKIELDTENADTDGTDAILLYDPTRYTATAITNGTIYPDYPGNTIDTQNGKVVVSGLASVDSPYKGKGILATVIFTVSQNAPVGASSIKFDFDPNNKAKTTDSNVVQRGTVTDILDAVTDTNLTVGNGTTCAIAQGGSTNITTTNGTGGSLSTNSTTNSTTLGKGGIIATPSASIPLKELSPGGKTPGFTDSTFVLVGIGSVLTILGIIGLALL